MRRSIIVLLGFILVIPSAKLRAQTPASFRVLFGVTDSSSVRWDGTLQVKSSGEYRLEPWRFEATDHIDGTRFHINTHPELIFGGNHYGEVVANGFIITVSALSESSEFGFTTAQGDFEVRASGVPFGKGIYKLAGRVYVDRLPVATRLTNTPDEEDYPSMAAGANGDVWLAYVQFHHGADADMLRDSPPKVPADFKLYAEPTGGDQIWAQKWSGGSWGEPIAVTSAGGDRYKTAVAVDGNGRAWIFWSENHGGNFDVFARAVDASGAKDQVQISREPGSDIDVVASTDANGRVWAAWQGWRNGVAAIFAARQEGGGFSKPIKVSISTKDEWNPAIAADKTGRVAVAWDSYRNGNYDVYARIWNGKAWGEEIPVAATAHYEAYPSIAYDPGGRLWIAYEEGGTGWGKDFGAYGTSGIPVYQGRLTKLRGIDPDGNLVNLDASLDSALVGVPNARADLLGTQEDSGSLDPNPNAALHRLPDAAAPGFGGKAKNTSPRLAVDGSGRIWIAFRTSHPTWWSSVGTAWAEYLVSFDGKEWTRPIFVNHTDNILDNRPALVAAEGKLLMVNSSDGRRDYSPEKLANTKYAAPDPYNNDLWSDQIDLGPASGMIPVVALGPQPALPVTFDKTEEEAIQAMRGYRGGPDKNLRIVRGDFHRHSEISMDGGNDGTLRDEWRYFLDAGALDWVGCCDHDNGNDREYSWWITQKLTDIFYTPGKFSPMFNYERSVAYPDGHRNVIFVERGIRPLPRFDPHRTGTVLEEGEVTHTPDTQMLYAYLRQFNGIVASHTSATNMGTDWRDNDPNAEPVVEIYQGLRQSYEMADSPRSNSEKDSIGGWQPKGYVSVALEKGYRLGFESSSDHISTHISYSSLYVKDLTRESVLDALKKRHSYASTDNILADVESGSHMMGDEFSTSELPTLKIVLQGTSQFAKVTIIRDGQYVYTTSPNTRNVEFSWRDNQPNKGKTSYYYVRGEQDNGEIVWISPMWITYTGQ